MTQVPVSRGSHAVRFFENEESAYRTIAEFFSEDARLDDCCIMIARTDTFAGVRQVLAAHPTTATVADRIRFVGAREGIAQFLTGDEFHRDRAEEFCLQVLSCVPAGSENAKVRLYGEVGDVLCERGSHEIGLQVEDLAGLLFALEPRLSILCGYYVGHFAHDHGAALRAVCGKHTDVGPFADIPDSAGPGGERSTISGIAAAASASHTVYVVDDDASMRRSLGRLLAVSNFCVRVFDSAEAFFEEAAAVSDGCLVLDIQLGGMTGLELIARLVEQGFRLPIIAMSGFQDEKTEGEALRLGARVFLHKPFEPEVLLDAIEHVVNERIQVRARPPPVEAGQ